MALPLSDLRFLVVEDEYYIADDIAQALRRQGADVLGPAMDPAEALALLEDAGSLDGAILVVNLCGMPVYPVAEALRRRAVPFMFATGYDGAVIPDAYADVPRWEKPFSADLLARRLPGLMRVHPARPRIVRAASR